MRRMWWGVVAGSGLVAGLILGGTPGSRVGWASWAWWQAAQREVGQAVNRFLAGPRPAAPRLPVNRHGCLIAICGPSQPHPAAPPEASAPSSGIQTASAAPAPVPAHTGLSAIGLPPGWYAPGPTTISGDAVERAAHRDNGGTIPAGTYVGETLVAIDGPAFYGPSWPADQADPERMAPPGMTVTPITGPWPAYLWFGPTATGPDGQPQAYSYELDWVVGNHVYEARITQAGAQPHNVPMQWLLQTTFDGQPVDQPGGSHGVA